MKKFLKHLGGYFNLLADKEDESEVIRQVSAGVEFRGTNLWILICAIFIASLGLNVNSTAVIIGAMLVSPLMGPIIGMGLAVGIGDYDLLRRALKNFAVATVISVLTATVYFLISPISDARSELLARTSPSLYDVLIAFFGGAAGVLALTTKSKGQVIPGVAIATALMPPLCTAGYGLATLQWHFFFGAFYLFFINSVFIALATVMGVKLLRFHSYSSLSPDRARRGRRLITWVVIITMLPAAVMTAGIVSKNARDRNIQRFVNHEIAQSGTEIISSKLIGDTINVVAVGRIISDEELADAQRHLGLYNLKEYHISVIQGGAGDQVLTVAKALNDEVVSLQRRLDSYTRYDTLSAAVTAEAAALFPEVAAVHVGRVGPNVTAHLLLHDTASLADIDTTIVYGWLRTRLQAPDVWIEAKLEK